MSLSHKTFRQCHGKFKKRKRLLRTSALLYSLRVKECQLEEEITDGVIST